MPDAHRWQTPARYEAAMKARIDSKLSHRRVQWRALPRRPYPGVVSRPAPPLLTIRHDGSQRSFAAGQEVVIGRDQDADLRIMDPRISRAHLILRFDQGRWLAIDNGSLNGTYLNGYRMPVIDIHDGQSINVGNPQGPRLTFAVGPQQGQTNRPLRTRSTADAGPPTITWSALPAQTNPGRPSRRDTVSQPTIQTRSGPNVAPPPQPPPRQPQRPAQMPPPPRHPVSPPRSAPPSPPRQPPGTPPPALPPRGTPP